MELGQLRRDGIMGEKETDNLARGYHHLKELKGFLIGEGCVSSYVWPQNIELGHRGDGVFRTRKDNT